jgi:hypothetical protein
MSYEQLCLQLLAAATLDSAADTRLPWPAPRFMRRPAPQGAAPVLPGDVRLMNVVASTVFVLAALALAPACSGWRARRWFAIRASARRRAARNSVETLRANAAPRLAGNFFSADLARAARRLRGPCPGCAVPPCAASGPTAWWCSSRSTAPPRCGRATTATTAGQHPGRGLRGQRGRRRGRGLPTFSGPEGSAAPVLAMYRACSRCCARAGHGRSSSCTCPPAAPGACCWTAAPRWNWAAAARTRWRTHRALRAHAAAGDRPLPRAAGIRRPAPRRRLCRAPARRHHHPPGPARAKPAPHPETTPWPKNTRTSSSAWTSAPPR